MLRRFLAKKYKSDIDHIAVLLIHRAQLQIRRDSGDLKRGKVVSREEIQERFERIYWLSNLCHGMVGPFSFSSKKLRQERLLQGLAWAWRVSDSEQRAWMVGHFEENRFDYSVLEDHDLGQS